MNLFIKFVAITMHGCGHVSALPRHTDTERRRDHKTFYCSTCGERNHYVVDSDLEKERAKTARAERQLKWREQERDAARNRAATADRRASAYKGHLKRQKTRSVAGLCPCCNRSFQQLTRHMKSKHPDYGEGDTS